MMAALGSSALLVVTAITLADVLSPFLEPGSREAQSALQKYQEGEWVEAIETYGKAIEKGGDPAVSYNLGAAAYKGQNYPEAIKAFEGALRGGTVDPGRVAYDVGNTLVRSGDLPGALDAYRNALRSNPDDEDARYNYELTLRQLEQGEDQDQNQDQDQEQGEEGENQESQSNEGAPPDSSGQSGSEGDPGEQPTDGTDEQQQPPQGEQEGQEPGRMLTPEEAKRLLNAVTPEERELIEARLKSSRRRKVEKDW